MSNFGGSKLYIEQTGHGGGERVTQPHEILSVEEVLEIIAPLDPDQLRHLGRGVYEAKWVADEEGAREVAALQEHPRVSVIEGPSDPLPSSVLKWQSMKFSVKALASQRSEATN